MTKKIFTISILLVFLVGIMLVPTAFAASATLNDTATVNNSVTTTSVDVNNVTSNSASNIADNVTQLSTDYSRSNSLSENEGNQTIPPQPENNGTGPMINGTLPNFNGTLFNGTGPVINGNGPMVNWTLPNFNGTLFNGTGPVINGTMPGNGTGFMPQNNITTGNTKITGQNLTTFVGSGSNYTATLTDENGTALANQTVYITISRLSRGISKTYTVVTDENGKIYIPIYLSQGYYTVETTYNGTETYSKAYCNNIIAVVSKSEKEGTVFKTSPFHEKFGEGQNYTATLYSSDMSPMVGQHCALNLTRLWNGANKVYWATTDTNGEVQLPINLSPGNYTVVVTFYGDNNYAIATVFTTITVNDNQSIQINGTIPQNNGTMPGNGTLPNGTVPSMPNGTMPGNGTGFINGTVPGGNPGSQTNTTTTTNTTTSINGETLTVSGTTENVNGGSYTTSTSDESVVLVTNNGKLTITNATITKAGGDSSNTGNSEFYGTNAGVLVQSGSTLYIYNTSISTNAVGANAVFSTGSGAYIYLENVTITTTGKSSSRGLDATLTGTIEAKNVTISTQGGSCAALATDRGEGTVTVYDSSLSTAGAGSPCIYSTGNISLYNSTGIATGAQIAAIEGKNTVIIDGCDMTCYGYGNRGDEDNAGVFIYQSTSGDSNVGIANFTATNSNLTVSSNSTDYSIVPMFFVTNTEAVINLENTTLSFGSNILLNASGNNQGWGTSGSNGATVTFNAVNENLTGNIIVDDISSLSLNLVSSTYTGTINAANSSGTIKVVLDSDSTWTLTGDCYITSINGGTTIPSNVITNGYHIYFI